MRVWDGWLRTKILVLISKMQIFTLSIMNIFSDIIEYESNYQYENSHFKIFLTILHYQYDFIKARCSQHTLHTVLCLAYSRVLASYLAR
jgi:hypothetical protein